MKIIVTGASRGIGYSVVSAFCAIPETRVVAISRNRAKLMELEKLCNEKKAGSMVPFVYDLENGDYEHDFLPFIRKELSLVDVLINNAGYLVNKPFSEITPDEFDRVFHINVKGPFRLIQSLKPLFTKDSHIVNIGSMGGVQGSMKFPGLSVYSASKGALGVLTECLAEELKEEQIKVNCLALGSVNTEMLAEAFPGYEAPLSSSEMARFIVDFSITGHRYFNGKLLPVSLSVP